MKLLALALAALALTGCAQVRQFTRADLQAAQAIAESRGDVTWAACMAAIDAEVAGLEALEKVDVKGLFSLATLAHEGYRESQAGVPPALRAACAEDALGVLAFFVKAGLAAAPGGGAASLLLGR